MAQSVQRPALGFGSGHDLLDRVFKPHVGLGADGVEPAWDSLSPSLSALLQLPFSLPLSIPLKISK